MSEIEHANSKLQFLLTESQLEDIYSSINSAIGAYTLRTQLLLSKPEKKFISLDEVYEDCFVLSLSKKDVGFLIGTISTNRDINGNLCAEKVRDGLERGSAKRKGK